jgi:phosphonate transport system substrate-binding protein
MKLPLLAATLLSAAPLAHTAEDITLSFGVYQTDKPTVIYKQFVPLLEHLEQSIEDLLGQPVGIEINIYKTYDQGLAAIVRGDVDFARVGPASFILAQRTNKEVGLLAQELKKGAKTFKGVIVVRTDSNLHTLLDLKDRTFAFGDPNSTIGRYLAQAELLQAGIHAGDLKSFEFLGRHDLVASRVRIGDFDAGSIKISTFAKANSNKELRVIHAFDNATKPWIHRGGLEPRVRNAMSKALIDLKDSQILASFKVSGFTRATPKDFEGIGVSMKRAEVDFAKK